MKSLFKSIIDNADKDVLETKNDYGAYGNQSNEMYPEIINKFAKKDDAHKSKCADHIVEKDMQYNVAFIDMPIENDQDRKSVV